MTDNQRFEKHRKELIQQLTERLEVLLPDLLDRYTFNEKAPSDKKSQQLSLNAKIGGKHKTYINVTNDVIASADEFVSLWMKGLIHYIRTVDRGREESRAAYQFQQLLANDPVLMEYTVLFLKRTYYRECYHLSKMRPTEEDAELWIGQNQANYGIMVTPRFKNGKWENDVSEIRRFRQDYWTIGHVLETGLLIPNKPKKITFSDLDQYLTFFEDVLVRQSGSPYERQIAERYCAFVRAAPNPNKVPLLIPELRYGGLNGNHIYRLDFTIINPYTLHKQGFELSPWSTHGRLTGLKGKTQSEINAMAKSNFEREMKKHKEYYRKFNIFTLIYTDEDLCDIDTVFDEIKSYLTPVRENKLMLEAAMEEIKEFKL